MALHIRICAIRSEDFELRPNKPGFANRCPACTEQDSVDPETKRGSDKELNQARKDAMRNLLYRKDT